MRRAVLLVCAAALAGCGTTASSAKFEGDQREVAEAVEGLQEAAGRLDEARLCQTVLARELVERMEAGGQDCRKEVSSALDDTDAVGLDIRSVRISGQTAMATVRAREGENTVERELRLVLERGDWRVAALGTPKIVPKS